MGSTLDEVAKELINNGKKVNLIYAFNGTGKTRLSRTFVELLNNS
jgi:wobble nucleotide-excising tRNase